MKSVNFPELHKSKPDKILLSFLRTYGKKHRLNRYNYKLRNLKYKHYSILVKYEMDIIVGGYK